MALPNPTLTWQMTAEQAVAGTSRQQTIDAIIAAVALLTGTDSNWTTSVPTGSDATVPGVVLIPPATSPILTKFSAIIGISDGTDPVAGLRLDGDAVVANQMFAGFGGQYVAGNDFFDHAEPFGTGVRISTYATQCARALAAGPVPSSVFVIASEEAIFIGYKYSDTEWYGGLFGAIIEPVNLGSAETGAAATGGERIYGMCLSGDTTAESMSANTTVGMITSGNNCFGFNGTADGDAKFAIFDPLADTTIIRPQMVRTNTTPTAVGMGLTLDGEPFFRAIYTALDASPFTAFGRMRQLYFWDRAQMRDVIQVAGPTDRGYVITGNSGGSPCEALVFGNA